MSQLQIDERIIDLKQRIEVIEQMVGVSTIVTGDQAAFNKQAVMDALVQIRDMKENLTKNKVIEQYMQQHNDVIGFAIKNQNNLMKAVDSVNDEIRQISIHYETILSILDKIKEIKKIQETLEDNAMVNSAQKDEALTKRIRDTENVVFERKKTSEILCKVLDEYNQLVTLLNKRVLYLDHLLSLKEQGQ